MTTTVEKHQLSCCALCQITANNETPFKELEASVEKLKKDAELVWRPTDRASGERACFVITTPNEDVLRLNLKRLGFKTISKFNRRKGYPEGMLQMWFLNW